jgi:hypothetical protein
MGRNRKHENKTQRLAKGVRKAEAHARHGRARKDIVRKIRGSNARRALADERAIPPLAKLLGALGIEKIRFQVIGMTAANLQGVPGSTIDVDLWLDLPPRQYIKAINVAVQGGAQVVRNTVVELTDGTLVNFIYEVTGLPKFARVIKKARKLMWNGMRVAVLPLELIKKSKKAIRRPKDLLHIKLIEQRLAVIKKTGK